MHLIEKIAMMKIIAREGKEEFLKNSKLFREEDLKNMRPEDSRDSSGIFFSFYNAHSELVGIASVTDTEIGEDESRTGGFITIGVSEEFKGKGYSKLMMDYITEKSGKDDLYSSIKKDNVKSINLHISKGFKPSSEKRMKYIESLGVNRNDGNIRLHKKVRK